MKIKIKMPQGESLIIGTALRQVLLSRQEAWRPVAVSLDRPTTLLKSTQEIVEGTTKIITGVLAVDYTPKEDISGDFLKLKFTFTKELRVKDLENSPFRVTGADAPIVTSLGDKEVTLTVVMRKAVGTQELESNSEFLRDNNEDPKSYFVVVSQHDGVEYCSVDYTKSPLGDEHLLLGVHSNIVDEKEVVLTSLDTLERMLKSFRERLKAEDPDEYTLLENKSQRKIGVDA